MQGVIKEFDNRVNEIIHLVEYCSADQKISNALNRLALVSAVSALDTFISDLILYKATKDRTVFLELIKLLYITNRADMMDRLYRMWDYNVFDSAEQKIIDLALKASYSNINQIQKHLSTIYKIKIPKNTTIADCIYLRHTIAHRSGRCKSGKVIELSSEEIKKLISEIKLFAYQIFNLIPDDDKRSKI